MLRAQHRGRSIQHDYKEFVNNATQQHRATVLELFNLVLGWGPASDLFWSGESTANILFSCSLSVISDFLLLVKHAENDG